MKLINLAFFLLLLPSLQAFAQPGVLDNTFNGTGKAIFNFDSGLEHITSLEVLPNGKLLACVNTVDFFVAQLQANGSLDTSFGIGGKATKHIGNSCRAVRLALQPDGKIILGGETISGDIDFALVRLLSTGRMDSSFGNYGVVTTAIGPQNDQIRDIALQSDGKIIAVGYIWGAVGGASKIGIVRYNTDGGLDTTFGTGGKTVPNFTTNWESATCVALQPDGKIVVGGVINDDYMIARFHGNGTVDTSFGTNGLSLIHYVTQDACFALDIQPDGKILAGGTINSDFGLIRLKPDGSRDSSFGNNGRVTTDFGNGIDDGWDLLLQPDGRVLLIGTSANGIDNDFAMSRYNSDGSPDTSFANGGKTRTDLGDDDMAFTMKMQADGKYLLGGVSGFGTGQQSAVIRVISGLNLGVVTFDREDFNALVYPNPLKENNILQFELKQTEILTISLVNAAGQLCRTFARNEKFDRGKHELPVRLGNELAAGSYFLTLKNGKGQTAIKVIK